MNADVTSNYHDWTAPPRKRQKARLGNPNFTSRTRGVELRDCPITALTFAPGREDLVSAGSDGRMHHWDLRRDSCFVSSLTRATPKGAAGSWIRRWPWGAIGADVFRIASW